MTNLEIDTLSRNKIVSDINTNFFVEAGAGSGKTTMLVNRMVAMVENGININKICAITFTKAAANEFYDRFQKLLIERSNPDYIWDDKGIAGQLPCPTPLSRSRCEEALRNIDLCFMGTIDSFCNMVLSEHPSAAKIPSDSTLITDVDAAVMYSQYYVKICEGEYGDELAGIARTFNLLHKDGKKVFAECMPFFMDNRNVHFDFPRETNYDIDQIFGDVRNGLIELMKFLCSHKELKYEGNKESVAVWEEIEKYYRIIKRRWSTNYYNLLFAISKLPKICIINEAADHYPEIVNEWFEKRRGFYSFTSDFTATSDELNKLRYSISMTLFDECKAVFEKELREKGRLTFFDYLFYLRNMLKEDAENNEGKLIKYINQRHSYFLIDEFQDTNPMQAEVFFYLSSETPHQRWEKCLPKPGSLFIVGDPKQSIYRFRGADVRSFLYVKELFIDHVGEVLSLCRNFRSTRTLCEYFNRVFDKLLPQETTDQSKYEEIPLPEETHNEFQGIYKFNVYEGKASADYPDQEDRFLIPDMIRRLVNQDKYLIRAKGDKEPRPIRYSDFMIITYGKLRLAPIMEELRALEIPVKVEGKIPFETNEALKETFILYSAITNTDDMLALYGSLTGKIFNFCDKDILDYKDCGGALSLKSDFDRSACSNEYALKVADAMDTLKAWNKKSLSMSPAALFVNIIEGFKIFNYVSAVNIEVLYYTIELIRNAEKAGIIVNHRDCVMYVSELLSGNSDQERCLALSDNIDCVRMANLHKVKGLEAPIIILAGASNRERPVTKRIEHKPESTEGYVFRIYPEDSSSKKAKPYFETSLFRDFASAEELSRNAETQRLIYVGATRARNALIIAQRYQYVGKSEEPSLGSKWAPIVETDTPDIFEFLGEPDYKVSPSDKVSYSDQLYSKGEEESVIKPLENGSVRSNEKNTYTLVNPSMLRVVSKVSESHTKEDDDNVEIVDRRYPRLLGTTVHRLMEILVSSKGNMDSEAIISEVIREFKHKTDDQIIERLSASLKSVVNTMKDGGYPQTNGLPQDLLEILINAEEVYCEVPFSYKDGDQTTVIKGIMDVVYCSEGKWHIIDYKTNAEGDDLDTKYQNQLSAYVKAFKETTGEDADARTYHIDV